MSVANKIGDAATAEDFCDRSLAILDLCRTATREKGFTVGLLACIRARATSLVADVLALTPASPAAAIQQVKDDKQPVTKKCGLYCSICHEECPLPDPFSEGPGQLLTMLDYIAWFTEHQKTCKKAPTLPTEKPAQQEQGQPRRSPRKFTKVTPEVVHRALSMCALDFTNAEISDKTGLCPGMVQRLRSRSRWAKKHWPAIDSWQAQNPKADVHYKKAGAK